MPTELQLTIAVLDLHRVQARTSDGAEEDGTVQHDRLRASTIRVLDNWLRTSAKVSRDELEVLGAHLFEVLFSGKVRELLSRCLKEVDGGAPLRVQLSFKEEAQELAKYPWEYLFFRDDLGAYFLCTHAKLLLSRYMPSNKARHRLAPQEHHLRILLAVAEPDDKALGPVAAQPVIEAVELVAGELTQQGRGAGGVYCPTEVRVLAGTTLDSLIEAIGDFEPHVVHLIGHGRFDRLSSSGAIALLADDGRVRWVPDTLLNELFGNCDPCPRLVFLHMCHGGAVDLEKNFAGVAPQLIAAGVQAVVAMQHPIENGAAILFAKAFYKQIGAGAPVDRAVQMGRAKISSAEAVAAHAFGTPVLYIQSSDGVILSQPQAVPEDDVRGGARTPPRSTVGGSAVQRNGSGLRAAPSGVEGPRQRVPQPGDALSSHPAGGASLGLESVVTDTSPTAKALRKAGRLTAAKQRVMTPDLASRIDRLAALAVDQSRTELENLAGQEPDFEVLQVWIAMLQALD